MPRKWSRANRPLLCGRCNAPIARNDVVLVISLVGITTELPRCTQCAGEPAPTDLPDLAPDAPTSNVVERFNAMAARFVQARGQNVFDFKARQAKD